MSRCNIVRRRVSLPYLSEGHVPFEGASAEARYISLWLSFAFSFLWLISWRLEIRDLVSRAFNFIDVLKVKAVL